MIIKLDKVNNQIHLEKQVTWLQQKKAIILPPQACNTGS
jgi:hypothetical protein